jgi:hypothetical protein
MPIQFIEPLSRAWGRAKKALFRPANPAKWIAVGFTAFLSSLTDCGGSSGANWKSDRNVDWEEAVNAPYHAWEWLIEHPIWVAAAAGLVIILFVLLIVILWVSSRGKFMFLDNVIHDRALVRHPWREYRTEGNSLFLWTLVFTFFALAVVVTYAVGSYFSLYALYEQYGAVGPLLVPALWMLFGFLIITALAELIDLLVVDFVVPIMYKFRLTTLKAWGVFLPLLSAHILSFAGYALLLLLLYFGIVVLVILAGCLTCCIGFLLLAIPFVGTVILLPALYTLRAFSVEFLQQFGPDYALFPPQEGPVAADGTPIPGGG